MSREIYINLAVKDLNKTKEFFAKLGFKFNPEFTDKNAACMIIGENINVMLLVEKFFKSFIKKEITDAKKNTEVILAISVENREKVEEMIKLALDAGAKEPRKPQDYGWMYNRSFEDIDGHLWEVFFMDVSKRDNK